MQERWWDRLFVNEPAIDTHTIDCSRPMEELQPDAQATCERLLFDERQKQLGLPTSQQMVQLQSTHSHFLFNNQFSTHNLEM